MLTSIYYLSLTSTGKYINVFQQRRNCSTFVAMAIVEVTPVFAIIFAHFFPFFARAFNKEKALFSELCEYRLYVDVNIGEP